MNDNFSRRRIRHIFGKLDCMECRQILSPDDSSVQNQCHVLTLNNEIFHTLNFVYQILFLIVNCSLQQQNDFVIQFSTTEMLIL